MTKPTDKNLLNKPLTSWFQFNWETIAYALIVLVAIICLLYTSPSPRD